MRLRAVRSIAAACVLCAPAGQAHAQPPAGGVSEPRERIGLALSGGGARGGAHIGVLKALEELRVPIDYIAGTSVGAAVGGFYASGMSVAEIEDFVNGVDWQSAFVSAAPRRLRSFRRKRDDDLFLVDQRPGWNEGQFELPTGVVQGQTIEMILSRLFLPVTHVDDFDTLRFPFRAVSADISTAEAIVLGSGDLARAIRASMAVPAAFTPIEIDGTLLVDGGIAMNLPVEVVQDLGAEIVIAVDISSPLSSREDIRSVVDITDQLSTMLTLTGTSNQIDRLGERDVLLQPNLPGDTSSYDFSRFSETIQYGYDAVMARRDALSALALEPADYARYRASLHDPRADTRPVIDFIRIENGSPIADSIIEARLSGIAVGEPMDLKAVEQAVNRVYGLELYQNVRYRVVEDGQGRHGLEVELVERSWGPNYLQLGLRYSSSSDVDTLFGLAASYLRTQINPQGGEWRTTFFVGDEPAFLADLFQPLGPDGLYFVAPGITVESPLVNVFDGEDRVAEVKLRQATIEIGAGRQLRDWGEIRMGIRRGAGKPRLKVGTPGDLPLEDFQRGEYFSRFSFDTLDSIRFPRSGAFTTVEWRGSRTGALSADVDYDQLLVTALFAKTWDRHTLLSTLRYDSTISGTAPINGLNRMGGFLDLSGYARNQLSGQHAARVGLSWYRRIGDLSLFPAFAGVSVELGNVWDERSAISVDDTRVGGSIWAGVDTPVGPVYLAYGHAEGNHDAFYVTLGRLF